MFKTREKNNFCKCETGIEKIDASCITRSEIYALLREVINKRKNGGDYNGICAHIFEDSFDQQIKYIRENIKSASVTADRDHNRKRLAPHRKRIEKTFNLNINLQTEYQESLRKYNGAANKYSGYHEPLRVQRVQ